MEKVYYLKTNQLEDFALELSKWNPIPYPLVYVAKHELKCRIGMEFYVDQWPSCSAAVIIPSADCNFPFMKKAILLDAKDSEKLLDLLNEVPIDWTTDFYFSAIFQPQRPICERASAIHGTLFGDILEHTMVQKTMKNKEINVPQGYKMGKLDSEEASTVMKAWKFTGHFSEESIKHRVEHSIAFHTTVAIRDNDNNLVAYELSSPHGTMGMLFVDPKHRGNGLGSAVVAQLSKELCSEGHYRYCHVGEENPVSIKLHQKCEFVIEEQADILWIFFKPK